MALCRAFAPLSAGALLAVAVLAPADVQDDQARLDREFKAKVKPVVDKYCVSCHGGTSPTSGFSLEKPLAAADVTKNPGFYENLVFMVKSQSMP